VKDARIVDKQGCLIVKGGVLIGVQTFRHLDLYRMFKLHGIASLVRKVEWLLSRTFHF
jgi:hypothetical protein